MTGSVTKRNRNKLLGQLLFGNRISREDAEHCYEQNESKINNMSDIFYHKSDEDQRFTLEIVDILSQDQGEVMTWYGREHNLTQAKTIHGNIPRKDVVLLLTACFYNSTFFSLALSICKNIKRRIEGEQSPLRIVKKTGKSSTWDFKLVDNMAGAASGEEDADPLFGTDDILWNGISCTWYKIDRQDGMIEYQFHFNDPNSYPNLSNLKLELTVKKGDVLDKKIPLYWEESVNSGKTVVYSTGPIPIVEREAEVFISEIAEGKIG